MKSPVPSIPHLPPGTFPIYSISYGTDALTLAHSSNEYGIISDCAGGNV